MILVGAMKALQTPGLSKTEITRLRSLVQASSLYQVKIAEYIDYRETEKELVEMGRKYRELAQREPALYKPVEAKQEPHEALKRVGGVQDNHAKTVQEEDSKVVKENGNQNQP